jgi:hypothetical protein
VVLHPDVRPRLPRAPGHVERCDCEYERHGTATRFVLVEPLAGGRHVAVTAHRTKQDDAECLRELVEERYPDAECRCVVQDNLTTHTAGALYETLPAQQSRRIVASLEVHYSPKHGSWRSQAERARSIVARGCLSRPLGDAATLQQRVSVLAAQRNTRRATIDWQFSSYLACVERKKLYSVGRNQLD